MDYPKTREIQELLKQVEELRKQVEQLEIEELKKYAPKPVIDHQKNLDDFMESIGLSMEDGEKFIQLYNLAKKKKKSGGTRAAPVRAPEGFIKSFRVTLKELTESSTKRFYMKDGNICEYNAAYSYKNNPAFKQYMDNSGTMKKKPHTWSNSTKVIPGSMGLKQGQDYYIYNEGERPDINWD